MRILKLKKDESRLFLIQPDLSARRVEMRARTTLEVLRSERALGLDSYPDKGVTLYYWEDAPRDYDLERNMIAEAFESGGALATTQEVASWNSQPNMLAIREMPKGTAGYLSNYLHASKCWLKDHPYVRAEIKSALFSNGYDEVGNGGH